MFKDETACSLLLIYNSTFFSWNCVIKIKAWRNCVAVWWSHGRKRNRRKLQRKDWLSLSGWPMRKIWLSWSSDWSRYHRAWGSTRRWHNQPGLSFHVSICEFSRYVSSLYIRYWHTRSDYFTCFWSYFLPDFLLRNSPNFVLLLFILRYVTLSVFN